MENAPNTTDPLFYDLVILGAGYGGLMAALRLAGRKHRPPRIALINERDEFTERIRLQERIAAAIPSRLPSISALVAGTGIEFIAARVVALDADRRRVSLKGAGGTQEIAFGRAIYALGSRSDIGAVPGATEHAYHLDAEDGPRAVAALHTRLRDNTGQALRVVVIGGGNTATEIAGEIKTAWPSFEVTMVAQGRCGDFGKGEALATATRAQLEALGVRLLDEATVTDIRARAILTGSGERIPCDICIWAGGLRAAGLARAAGVACDAKDRIWVDPGLRSVSHPHLFAIGDAAHPIAPTGAVYRLSAFAAFVSGAYVADSIAAEIAGRQSPPFAFSSFGQGVAIGAGGVGLTTYPDDRTARFILKGRLAHRVRNLFVWFTVITLKLERKFPGSFYFPGRQRVSWQRAEEAMRSAQPVRSVAPQDAA